MCLPTSMLYGCSPPQCCPFARVHLNSLKTNKLNEKEKLSLFLNVDWDTKQMQGARGWTAVVSKQLELWFRGSVGQMLGWLKVLRWKQLRLRDWTALHQAAWLKWPQGSLKRSCQPNSIDRLVVEAGVRGGCERLWWGSKVRGPLRSDHNCCRVQKKIKKRQWIGQTDRQALW